MRRIAVPANSAQAVRDLQHALRFKRLPEALGEDYLISINTRPGEGDYRITDMSTLNHRHFESMEEALHEWAKLVHRYHPRQQPHQQYAASLAASLRKIANFLR